MKHHERDREHRPDDERGIGSEEDMRNRPTNRDAERQRDGNLGNERNRNRPDSDPEWDDDGVSER
jgi:hypothetical protein